MSDTFDLTRYLERIGYSGPRAPTLPAMREIHARHAAAIPFENIDPLLGRPVDLDLPALQAKIIHNRRGGYCFEQNTLLASALEALGFDVTRLAARVRWMAPPDQPEGPRSHMLLRVEIDGAPYIADVGFGGYILAGPLRFTPGLEQNDWGNRLRFVESDARYTLQIHRSGDWHDIYRFALELQMPADYMVSNWWTSTRPGFLLTENLLAERLTPEARYSLFNKQLTTRYPDGRIEQRKLTSAGELGAVLTKTLGIDLPAEPEAIWARLPKD